MDKPCHIIGFPIISKLIRGHTVELSDVCLIPDDQLCNESNNMYACVVFDKPQKPDTEGDSQNVNQQLKSKIADYVCAELLISKHSDKYKKVLSAIECATSDL